MPSGAGRYGAVKYTDYAIKNFIQLAKSKPWFKNTVFVVMADHCASSAGKRNLDVAKYHIPGFICNLPQQEPEATNKICSQIDVFPTLFGYLNWTYESQLLGKDISKMDKDVERALIGNYRSLCLLKDNKLMVLNDKKSSDLFNWNNDSNDLTPAKPESAFLKTTLGYYHSNDYFYQNNYYKLEQN